MPAALLFTWDSQIAVESKHMIVLPTLAKKDVEVPILDRAKKIKQDH